MKHILIIILFLQINLLFSQDEITIEFPKLELTYSNEIWNSDTNEWENIFFTSASPQMSYEFNYKNRKILVAFFFGEINGTANVIGTYINFADTWQPVHQLKIDFGEIYKELKFLTTDNSKYVYFEYRILGGAGSVNGSHTFALFDIINNEIYELSYQGEKDYEKKYVRIKNGTFEFNNLMDYPEIFYLLENQAKESKYIVRN